MSLKVRKAIIPAGGLGTRFLPVSAAIPKEIFPVFDMPLIYYAIEELKEAGVEEICLVVSPWKKPLFENFFNIKEKYSKINDNPAKSKILQKTKFLETWPEITFVIQYESKGLAEAIGLCKKSVAEEPFFVLLPDEVFISPTSNPSQKLLSTYQKFDQSVVGLFEVPKAEVIRYGIADLGDNLHEQTYELKSLVEKPSADKAPSPYMLPGRYLFKSDFWSSVEEELAQIKNLKESEELHITRALDRMASAKKLLGEVVLGERFDAGQPEGLLALSQFEFSRTNR